MRHESDNTAISKERGAAESAGDGSAGDGSATGGRRASDQRPPQKSAMSKILATLREKNKHSAQDAAQVRWRGMKAWCEGVVR